jgi:hypothetical protein
LDYESGWRAFSWNTQLDDFGGSDNDNDDWSFDYEPPSKQLGKTSSSTTQDRKRNVEVDAEMEELLRLMRIPAESPTSFSSNEKATVDKERDELLRQLGL